MLSTSSLLSCLLLATSITGALASVAPEEPKIVTLPFKARSFANDGSLTNIVKRDALRHDGRRAHMKARMEKRQASPSSIVPTNTFDGFTAQVSIGSPATIYNLLIDTRGGNTWVGSGTPYKKTSTSKSTGKQVSVSYTGGAFSGVEYTDTVSLSPSLSVTSQSIGVAASSSGFDGFDGVLGLGPVASTAGTVKGASTVPTFTDNLLSQGKISSEVIGISFFPSYANGEALGELTFGGVDKARIGAALVYTPTLSTPPWNEYWAFNMAVTWKTTLLIPSVVAIIDASSPFIRLPHNAYVSFLSLTGATPDSATGLLRVPPRLVSSLSAFVFNIGGTNWELTGNAITWPTRLNAQIGGAPDGVYLVVVDGGQDPATSNTVVLGWPFLQRFYVVLDTANSRVGLTVTGETYKNSN